MISVDGKETDFPVKLKLEMNRLNKDIKKENFKKDLMNKTEANYQTNMASTHSDSSKKQFESHLNAKSFRRF